MLKLKKLQILGFKSFCDRTELKFQGDGVAAIVGPNGCGKSNISDAISWVLGEQSARSLRGVNMQDVIFAGTRERKPTGMAEVTLTLVDPDVYGDAGEPEIDIQDELPESDWDESAIRSAKAEDAERYTEEVRPGQGDEEAPEAAEAGSAPLAEAATIESVGQHVVLKIRRRKFKRTFKAGEIAVTRRLFRSGESEYLLNGKLCRLRDIQDIFMGTGLGPESYAIIEQGRIGQILSSKPTDRRAIIEEAAGITKFKTRKRLAEARLEDAKLNLARINDIFDEVTRQMNSLKRQASKAERYAKLRDEMRAKLRVVLASKFAQLDAEAATLEEELTAISEEMRVKGDAVETMEGEHGERTQRGYAIEREANENRDKLNAVVMEIDRAIARRRTNDERCAELDARSAGAQAELGSTEEQIARHHQELDANRAILESASADVALAQEELHQRQQEATQASSMLMDVERQQEERRAAILQSVSAASSVRNRITQAEERIAALDRESRRIEQETTTAHQQLESFGGQRGQLGLEFESSSQRVEALAGQIDENRRLLAQKRADETHGKQHLDTLRAGYAGLIGKKGSLEAVITEHGYSTDSVRRLFKSGAMSGGMAPVGVLADFLEVEDRYEHVVDDFLRDELNYIVVKSWDAADEGLRLLRSDVDGRATFLVHPEDSQAKFSFLSEEGSYHGLQRDTVVPLKHCIRVLDGFGKSLEVILPKLGNGYIVPDPEVGRDLALQNPDAFFLSQSGECFHNVTVTGGKQRSEGPLALKRELREVLRQAADVEGMMASEQTRVAVLTREIGDLTSLLQRLEDDKREAERQAMTSGHTLQQLDSEMTRVRERLGIYEREMTRLVAECGQCEVGIAAHRTELLAHDERKASLEVAMEAAQSSFDELRQRRDAAAQHASDARAKLATLEERRRGSAVTVQRLEAMVAEVASRLDKLKGQIESAAAEKEQREQENGRLAEQEVQWTAERDAAQLRDRELQKELQSVRVRLAELEESLKTARHELDAARDRRGELAAEQARLQSDAQHMAETCIQELSQPREELLADASLARLAGEELTNEDGALQRHANPAGEHGPGEHDGARGVPGDGAAPRVPRDAAARPAAVHREHAEHHQGNRHHLAAEV